MDNNFCFSAADILLPKKDYQKFSVIACDQFTSEPEYWEKVKQFTKGCPTALDLILPEIYLSDDNTSEINRINGNMKRYLAAGVFKTVDDSFIYVRRTQSDGVLREGIVGKIDLKEYSYLDNGRGSIRSTEKTVLERIPARADIRRGAAIEMPHIMLLYNDEQNSVTGLLNGNRDSFKKLYDFTLFGNAGSVEGYRVTGDTAKTVIDLLAGTADEKSGLVFCVGDGNHSLAAAKSIYEQSGLEKDRYALAEIVNIHSPAINFEPIYRVAFGVDPREIINEFVEFCKTHGGEYEHTFRCVYSGGEETVTVKSKYKLPVAALQNFLDSEKADVQIDYIHGIPSAEKIARDKPDRVGFIFEGMKKEELFSAVIKNGSLPRKTFSLGHALDKRFYLEARAIG